ncbi:ligase-associated DNA damage response endonuclease PdeM [Poseidonocella pacifica]|nr:ligase-associated DNA damage response endonuclease PdeM [Poseidonocella pacifica]
MNAYSFTFADAALEARHTGALFWPAEKLLCVSDLHLGKAARINRREGRMLPPYEVTDTLLRLEAEIAATEAETVLCLGDSFDDLLAGAELEDEPREWILRLQAGRRWIWLEGNHDPAPLDLGGETLADHTRGRITFRHIAQDSAQGEISGHYHPKARPERTSIRARPAFLICGSRIILPAFGTYTGGLAARAAPLNRLIDDSGLAVMTGPRAVALPISACAAR